MIPYTKIIRTRCLYYTKIREYPKQKKQQLRIFLNHRFPDDFLGNRGYLIDLNPLNIRSKIC